MVILLFTSFCVHVGFCLKVRGLMLLRLSGFFRCFGEGFCSGFSLRFGQGWRFGAFSFRIFQGFWGSIGVLGSPQPQTLKAPSANSDAGKDEFHGRQDRPTAQNRIIQGRLS